MIVERNLEEWRGLVEAHDCCNGDRDAELSRDIEEGVLELLQIFLGVFADPKLLSDSEDSDESDDGDEDWSEEYCEGHLEDV